LSLTHRSAAELKIPIKHFPADNTKLAEMEFYLLEDLDFHLHVFHPYRSLTALCGREPMDTGWFPAPGEEELEEDVKLGRGTGKGAVRFDKEIFETAWCVQLAHLGSKGARPSGY
jgi:cyclin C